jgi:hypothetical protein
VQKQPHSTHPKVHGLIPCDAWHPVAYCGIMGLFHVKRGVLEKRNTTIFSVLWPPSIALWGPSVPPYTLVVRLE